MNQSLKSILKNALMKRLNRQVPEIEEVQCSFPVLPSNGTNQMAFQAITTHEAALRLSDPNLQVLDVPFDYEYQSHHITRAVLIPLPQLPQRYQELELSQPILVVCEHGVRSRRACEFLSDKGFKDLFNVLGGMSSYRGDVDGSH